MDWAVTHGYRLDNPADRALLKVLPPVKRLKKHHSSLPYEQLPGALAQVRESTAHALTKLALEFLVLTAARSGEVRKANWAEVNWDTRTWEIPAIKMKARRLHRVPLSDRALVILQEAWAISAPDGLVFPARPGGKAVSDMTFTALLRRLGTPAVPHGFRRSFRNRAAECMSGWSSEAEAALAHQVRNKTEAAYMTTDLLEQRRGLMQRWADYVAGNS